MIEILQHLQQYVPKQTNGNPIPILLGGDALSVERGEAAKLARMDAIDREQRLEGLVWKSEDWHAHVIALQDSFDLLYKASSKAEKGTLFQLRNQFDRRGVKTEVKNAVNDNREFFQFITQGFCVLAAFEVLGISDGDELKKKLYELKSDEEKMAFMKMLSNKIIENFVATEHFQLHSEGQADDRIISRVACGYPGCSKTYAVNGRLLRKHREQCLYKHFSDTLSENVEIPNASIHLNDSSKSNAKSQTDENCDRKFNYSCCVLREGLMDWCRNDAARENDGERLIRLWRFDMLRFALGNHTKYRLLAFKLQAQLMALLPPKLAHELKHNRCVNIHGGIGRNVPCDQGLEFLNMIAKDALNGLHGNLTSAAIQRCGRSLKGCNCLIDTYSEGLQQYFGKPNNPKPSFDKDIALLVESMTPHQLFRNIPGRFYESFKKIEFNTLIRLNGQNLDRWLTEKKEAYARTQRSRSYYM